LYETHLTDKIGSVVQTAPCIDIANRIRLHWHLSFDGCFKQVGVKGQYRTLWRRSTFGEERNALAIMNTFYQSLVDPPHITRTTSGDEDSTGVLTQPANQRPAADIRFRHKPAAVQRIDDENIEP